MEIPAWTFPICVGIMSLAYSLMCRPPVIKNGPDENPNQGQKGILLPIEEAGCLL